MAQTRSHVPLASCPDSLEKKGWEWWLDRGILSKYRNRYLSLSPQILLQIVTSLTTLRMKFESVIITLCVGATLFQSTSVSQTFYFWFLNFVFTYGEPMWWRGYTFACICAYSWQCHTSTLFLEPSIVLDLSDNNGIGPINFLLLPKSCWKLNDAPPTPQKKDSSEWEILKIVLPTHTYKKIKKKSKTKQIWNLKKKGKKKWEKKVEKKRGKKWGWEGCE